jgi:hypothetical protein
MFRVCNDEELGVSFRCAACRQTKRIIVIKRRMRQ